MKHILYPEVPCIELGLGDCGSSIDAPCQNLPVKKNSAHSLISCYSLKILTRVSGKFFRIIFALDLQVGKGTKYKTKKRGRKGGKEGRK